MKAAHEASGADMVTVAVRRVDISRKTESLLDYIDTSQIFLLPNTAACYTADDAIRTARLGREAGMSNWVKLEVIGDETDAVPRQRGTARSDARAGQGRLRRPALHQRRSGDVPQARRRRRGRGDAARRADRLRPRASRIPTTSASSRNRRRCR